MAKSDLANKIKAAKNSTEIIEAMGEIFNTGRVVDEKVEKKYEVIPTQYPTLNNYLFGVGGLPRGRAIEIAGSPSIGKTTFTQNIISYLQKNGSKILWVPAEPIDPYYAKQSGMDLRTKAEGCENPIAFLKFSDSEDCANKIKLALALNHFDLIVVDSVQAVNTPEIVGLQGKSNMFVDASSAKFWQSFLRGLEGGFSVKIGDEFVPSGKPILEFKEGKFTPNNNIHKLEDKKTAIILINHLKNGIGMFSIQYTPGGVGKDFRFSHRLFINPLKGGTKINKGTGEIIYRDLKITSKKSKLGAPSGRTVLVRMENGIVTGLEAAIEEENDEVEATEENTIA